MEPIVIPELACPFPAAINPHVDKAQQATVAWARRLRLLEHAAAHRRIHQLQCGWLCARAYPHASPETLQIVTDFGTWLFLLDDQCDEDGLGTNPDRMTRRHTRFVDVLRGIAPREHDEPLAHALWDLHLRMKPHAPEGWLERFGTTVEQYLSAIVWEATNRRRGHIPDAASYCAMRLFTSTMYCCILLFELTEELRLPPEVYDHPDVQRLATMTNNIVSWDNDIFSVGKERRHGDVHNLVLIVAHEQQLSLQAAVDRVSMLHDAEVHAFIALAQGLPSFTPELDRELKRYIAGMRSWIRGNLDWSRATRRYQPTPVHSAVT
jgi:Terpene synthase family 2, C-terminal metal binding